MEKIEELLKLVHKTNPYMTLEKLMEELSITSDYGIFALSFSKFQNE